jgi:hypothetical protein
MLPRLRLWHTWQRQMEALLPSVRVTRVRVLTLFVLGVLWSGSVTLLEVAAALPLAATDASTERRVRRWLANPAVVVAALWRPLLPSLLAARAGRELLLVFDPTPHRDWGTILCLGLVDHRRILPLAWRVVPQQTPWPAPEITYLRAMGEEVAAALPPDCTVTLLADRGVTGPEVIDLCRALGWHFVFRVSVGASQTNRVRGEALPEQALWALVTGPGQRWRGTVDLFKQAGWRTVNLTIHWDRRYHQPWVLVSDRPAGTTRVHEYRRRAHAEATYEDCKSRGFAIERSKLATPDRLDRLLLVVHLALWWGEQLGLRVIRGGLRRHFDRADRRDLSVLRLGRRFLLEELAHDRCPPLPFHFRNHQWRYTWLT